MPDIARIGADWLMSQVDGLTDTISHVLPSTFNEETRYIPSSISPLPGYMRFSVNPFMREIVDCFDTDSPIREVTLKKGVQITYTTLLESGLLYYMAHVTTAPCMYVTADKELALSRVENNIIPMIRQSGLSDIIQSHDSGNRRKTGLTKDHIQWAGGGYLIPFGAINANKMRSFSIQVMLKDEIDAWPDQVGRDGDPDELTSARCSAYWERRKIFRGSTHLRNILLKSRRSFVEGINVSIISAAARVDTLKGFDGRVLTKPRGMNLGLRGILTKTGHSRSIQFAIFARTVGTNTSNTIKRYCFHRTMVPRGCRRQNQPSPTFVRIICRRFTALSGCNLGTNALPTI